MGGRKSNAVRAEYGVVMSGFYGHVHLGIYDEICLHLIGLSRG
jgi:hypothetical protein